MIISENPPIEQMFVVRLANCIRTYNTINNFTHASYTLSESYKAQAENNLKTYSDDRRALEGKIGEKYNLGYYSYQRIIKDLYAEMNKADGGFVMGEGSPMFRRLDDFIMKFIDEISKTAQTNAETLNTLKADLLKTIKPATADTVENNGGTL